MLKLLIVDDENDIRNFASSFFKKRGIEVLTASKGSEALSILSTEKDCLVLMDVRMKEMSGIEVLRELRKRENPVKVIMVTGVEEEGIVAEANTLGVLGYIHKPLILDELEKIVLSHLKQ